MTYAEKLRDPRWQKKRLKILERDSFSCVACGADDKPLQVHHCFYERHKEPWETDDRLLLSVCENCHEERANLEHDALRAVAFLLARYGHNDDGLDVFTSLAVAAAQDNNPDAFYTLEECE
jgi:5-methylcytosine-specific restriction endonuclease McrA